LGRVLATDLNAARTQPPADLSAMDGYAVAGEGPWMLVGESRAGAPFEDAITAGEAIRISTGAHMPQGSDRVLIQENAQVEGTRLSTDEPPAAMQHVRRRGFDFADGDTVLAKGTRIGPAQLALAMAAGHARLTVVKPPKVAVLDSGDELAADPSACNPHQIPASNGAMIAAMLAPLVGPCERLGPVGDSMDALAAALERADDCDVLITSGGASVGDHDLVQSALREWGADLAFWKVAIKPGKPLMVATREVDGRKQVVLGLPGNPVSSYVTAMLFALPLVGSALGIQNPLPAPLTMRAACPLPSTGSRCEFVRGICDGEAVAPADSQDSSALRALASANCLIERRPHSADLAVGEVVRVYWLENG
jgi:molybdopterin molybdotransferase